MGRMTEDFYDPAYLDYEEKEFLSYEMISCFQRDELSKEEKILHNILEKSLYAPKTSVDIGTIIRKADFHMEIEDVADLVRKVAHTQVTIDFRRISQDGSVIITDLFPLYEEVVFDQDTNEESFRYISCGYSAHYLSSEVMERVGEGKSFHEVLSDLLIYKRVQDDEIVDLNL